MLKEWGSISRRKVSSEHHIWTFLEKAQSEDRAQSRIAQLQSEDPEYEYIAQQYLPPPPTARRLILPDMTVGQLIDKLRRYDPQLKVVFPTVTGAHGVKVCYEYAVKQTNDFGNFELVPEWQIEEAVDLKTEQAVILDKDMKFI